MVAIIIISIANDHDDDPDDGEKTRRTRGGAKKQHRLEGARRFGIKSTTGIPSVIKVEAFPDFNLYWFNMHFPTNVTFGCDLVDDIFSAVLTKTCRHVFEKLGTAFATLMNLKELSNLRL